jgi:hypothetical protein
VFGASVFDELVGLEDVIANLLTPFSGFAGTELVDAFGVLFLLHLEEFPAENLHGLFFVLELGTFILDGNDGAGREMGNADGGVGCVDALAAVSAGMIDVDSQVFVVDF